MLPLCHFRFVFCTTTFESKTNVFYCFNIKYRLVVQLGTFFKRPTKPNTTIQCIPATQPATKATNNQLLIHNFTILFNCLQQVKWNFIRAFVPYTNTSKQMYADTHPYMHTKTHCGALKIFLNSEHPGGCCQHSQPGIH